MTANVYSELDQLRINYDSLRNVSGWEYVQKCIEIRELKGLLRDALPYVTGQGSARLYGMIEKAVK